MNGTYELLLPRWLAPMDAPVMRDGAVVISNGRIVATGNSVELREFFPAAVVRELGNVVLLPGLVNAHVHLELSALSPGTPPSSFVDWLKRLVPKNPPPAEIVKSFVERGVEIGVAQCLRFGVTSVGDISRQCSITRPLLARSGLNVVSYGEIQAMAQRRGLLDERLALAADSSSTTERLHIGISPHATYSVESAGYQACLNVAQSADLPLSTHLAETREEAEFLSHHTGPFRELWSYLDAWDEKVPTFVGGPIRFAAAFGLLDYPTLLAHVNYCDDSELEMLAASPVSVVYCPRTHAYFGHPPHRWREMLARGINIAVGTDSCASSADLNLVDDLRLLHKIAPEVPVPTLWEMATIRAARAIQCEDRVGSITAGKAADLVAFDVNSDDPLREILESKATPRMVWIEGVAG